MKLKKVIIVGLTVTMLLSSNMQLMAAAASTATNMDDGYIANGWIDLDDTHSSGRTRDGSWSGNSYIYEPGTTWAGVWSYIYTGAVFGSLGSRTRATSTNTQSRAWISNNNGATYGDWKDNGDATDDDTYTSQALGTSTLSGTNKCGWQLRAKP